MGVGVRVRVRVPQQKSFLGAVDLYLWTHPLLVINPDRYGFYKKLDNTFLPTTTGAGAAAGASAGAGASGAGERARLSLPLFEGGRSATFSFSVTLSPQATTQIFVPLAWQLELHLRGRCIQYQTVPLHRAASPCAALWLASLSRAGVFRTRSK